MLLCFLLNFNFELETAGIFAKARFGVHLTRTQIARMNLQTQSPRRSARKGTTPDRPPNYGIYDRLSVVKRKLELTLVKVSELTLFELTIVFCVEGIIRVFHKPVKITCSCNVEKIRKKDL